MNYHWTQGQLKARLKKLEQIRQFTKNNQDLRLINEDINNLKVAMVEFLNIPTSVLNQPLEQRIKELENDCKKIYYLLEDLIYFANNLYNPGFDNLPLSNLKLSKDDIYGLTHDFYKEAIGGKIYTTFLESYKERANHTRFVPRSIYSGQTLYFSYFNETFIESQYEHNILDILTLIHEHGHDIHFRFNFNQQNSDKLLIFSEIISETMEILAYDYFSQNKALKKDINNALEMEITNTWGILEGISYLIKIIIEYNDNKNIKLLRKEVFYKYGINETEFNFYLTRDYFNYVKYMIGKLLAIELRNIYFKDKEQFLYLINKIMAFKSLDPLAFYNYLHSLNLNFGENLLNYSQELKRKSPF